MAAEVTASAVQAGLEAEASTAWDASCVEQARLRASLPPEVSRARGAAYDDLNGRLESDPECRAMRAAGEDYTARAMELKRRAFERHGFRVRRVPAPSRTAATAAASTVPHRSSGHAPRPATNTRARGSRRNGTGSRAGLSDDPDESDSESERICSAPWCSHPVVGPPQQRYCRTERCDKARAVKRQQKRRRGGELTDAERNQLEHARIAGYLKFEPPNGEDDLKRVDIGLAPRFPNGEYEWLLQRAAVGCRCNGSHVDGGIVGCLKCGSPRKMAVAA